MIIKRGFIRLACMVRSWIVHNGHMQSKELKEAIAMQSKRLKTQNNQHNGAILAKD